MVVPPSEVPEHSRLHMRGYCRPGTTSLHQQRNDALGDAGRLAAQFRDRGALPVSGLAQRTNDEQVGHFSSLCINGIAIRCGLQTQRQLIRPQQTGYAAEKTASDPAALPVRTPTW